MAILLAVLLGLCVLAFVLYPIYNQMIAARADHLPVQGQEGAGDIAEASDTRIQPTEREQAARTALQEVELDYQLGNISQTDYNQLRERYTRRALVALKQRYEREQEIDATIEEQLCQMREHEEQGQEQHGETAE